MNEVQYAHVTLYTAQYAIMKYSRRNLHANKIESVLAVLSFGRRACWNEKWISSSQVCVRVCVTAKHQNASAKENSIRRQVLLTVTYAQYDIAFFSSFWSNCLQHHEQINEQSPAEGNWNSLRRSQVAQIKNKFRISNDMDGSMFMESVDIRDMRLHATIEFHQQNVPIKSMEIF